MTTRLPNTRIPGDALFKGHPVFGLMQPVQVHLGAQPPGVDELRTTVRAPAFTGTALAADEDMYFVFQVPHDFKYGSSFTPEFRITWANNQASPSGNVVWQIQYSVARAFSKDTVPAVTLITATQAAAAQYTAVTTDLGDLPISVGTLEPGAIITARLFRDPDDAGDTFGNDAALLALNIMYERGQLGTREKDRPYKLGFDE